MILQPGRSMCLVAIAWIYMGHVAHLVHLTSLWRQTEKADAAAVKDPSESEHSGTSFIPGRLVR